MFFGSLNAQNNIDDYVNAFVVDSKSSSKIDPKDLTVKKIYDSFYNEILQSKSGELSEEFATDLNIVIENSETKNIHLLSILFLFLEFVFQASENLASINSEIELKLIEKMETEFLALNQEIPVLVYIYKIQALHKSENFDEADKITDIAYEKFIKFDIFKSFSVFSYK